MKIGTNFSCYKFIVTGILIFYRLPDPTSPFKHLDDVFLDAFALAVVVFAISISMAKILAKKDNYEVDSNQVCLDNYKKKLPMHFNMSREF